MLTRLCINPGSLVRSKASTVSGTQTAAAHYPVTAAPPVPPTNKGTSSVLSRQCQGSVRLHHRCHRPNHIISMCLLPCPAVCIGTKGTQSRQRTTTTAVPRRSTLMLLSQSAVKCQLLNTSGINISEPFK